MFAPNQMRTERRRRRSLRVACYALAVVLALGSAACGGGGGGGGGGVMPLTATFTGSNLNPGNQTLSLSGTASGANFSVRVNVTGIQDFFGAGFRVTFNPASAQFVGFSSTGSVLAGQGTTDFRAQLGSAGQLLVNATLQGQVEGVDVSGTQLLITLNFRATTTTTGNPFGFDTASTRVVTTCPAPPLACSDIPDAQLTWSGGMMRASN